MWRWKHVKTDNTKQIVLNFQQRTSQNYEHKPNLLCHLQLSYFSSLYFIHTLTLTFLNYDFANQIPIKEY